MNGAHAEGFLASVLFRRRQPVAGRWPICFGLWHYPGLFLHGSYTPLDRCFFSTLLVVTVSSVPFYLLALTGCGRILRELEGVGVFAVIALAWLLVRLGTLEKPSLPYRTCYVAYRRIFAGSGRTRTSLDGNGLHWIFLAQLGLRFVGTSLFLLLLWWFNIAAERVFISPFPIALHFLLAFLAASFARVLMTIVYKSVR